MNDTPRKYKVSFECGNEHVGTILDVLVKQVSAPTVNPSTEDGRFKMACICWLSQVPALTTLVIDYIDKLVVAPAAEEVHPETRQYLPRKPAPVQVTDTTKITKIPTHIPARGRGRKASETRLGYVVMQAFNTKPIIHAPDLQDVLSEAGYAPNSGSAILAKMMREGSIVRHGYGSYRLPTEQEKIDFRKQEAGVS